MQEVEEVDLFLLTQLYALNLDDLALVLPQSHVDNSPSCIQESHYSLGEMELDGLVFKRPSVILEFLVG